MAENIINIRAPSAFSSSNPKVMDGGRGVRHDAIVFSTSSLAATIKSHRAINYIFMVWLAPVSLVMLHQTNLTATNQPADQPPWLQEQDVCPCRSKESRESRQSSWRCLNSIYHCTGKMLPRWIMAQWSQSASEIRLSIVVGFYLYMYIFVAYKSHVAGHSFWCRNVLQSKHCTLIRAEREKIRSRSPIYLKLSSYDHHPLIILLLHYHVSSFTLLFRGRLINHTHSRLCNPRINTQSAFLSGICSGKVWAF